MDTRLDPRLELGHRTVRFSETASNFYLELGVRLVGRRRDPGKHIAREQAQGDAVRIVNNDRLIGSKAEGGSDGSPGFDCDHEF